MGLAINSNGRSLPSPHPQFDIRHSPSNIDFYHSPNLTIFPIENWHLGKVISLVLVVAVCAGVIMASTFLLTPSEIREYRVQLDDRGVYRVIGVVRYGQDFISYQTTDGKDAIGIPVNCITL